MYQNIDIFGEDSIGDIYQKYANRIFKCSAIGANALRKINDGEMSRAVWVTILFEHIYFYMAVTAEMGLHESDDARQERILSKLAQLLIPYAADYVFDDVRRDGNEGMKCREAPAGSVVLDRSFPSPGTRYRAKTAPFPASDRDPQLSTPHRHKA